MHNFKRLSILITLSTLPIILYATQPPHTIKSWQVAEDDTAVYYSDQLSDGTETTRTITKPKPREYPVSITLVETNEFPVQVEYVYTELFADGRIATNHQYRIKSARERININLPPMPEIKPREPAKTDALGQALKRRRNHSSSAALAPLATHTNLMARPDRILKAELTGDHLTHTWASGKITTAPLKRAYTARVKSAPVVGSQGYGIYHPREPLSAFELEILEKCGSLIRGHH
ncbi:MAG: hypothetical protein WC277_06310 [Bacilli bacterium]